MAFRFPHFKKNYAVSGLSVAIIEKDIKEATNCFAISANKSTMLLCGSILENALLDYLSIDEWAAEQVYINKLGNRPARLEDWALFDMLRVSRELGIMSDETFQLCNLLRDYRNLIHPAVVRRTAMNPNNRRARLSLEALRQALGDLDSSFNSVWQNAYVINITGIGGAFISNPNVLQTAITNILQQHGITVNIISTFAQLNAILQNPPKYSIIANVHGEIMPVPPGTNWRTHYQNLSREVINSGWILLNIGGYPFYYEGTNQHVGDVGLNEFLSLSNMTANCMIATNAEFTNEGRQVIQALNMRGLPHALVANRSARWQGATQKIVFLSNGHLSGISAVRLGRGWFVNVGLDSNLGMPTPTAAQLSLNDQILGNFGAGAVLLIAGLI